MGTDWIKDTKTRSAVEGWEWVRRGEGIGGFVGFSINQLFSLFFGMKEGIFGVTHHISFQYHRCCFVVRRSFITEVLEFSRDRDWGNTVTCEESSSVVFRLCIAFSYRSYEWAFD